MAAVIQLDYSKRPRRHLLRAIIAVVALELTIFWCFVVSRTLCDRLRVLQWQHRCLAYAPLPDVVVYEADPQQAQLHMNQPDCGPHFDEKNPCEFPVVRIPECVRKLDESVGMCSSWLPLKAVVFLHERTMPDGQPVLVFVITYMSGGTDAYAVIPGSLTSKPTGCHQQIKAPR